MTRLLTQDIDYLLNFNPRWLEFLTSEKASTAVKVTIADAVVLPNALEARLKLSLNADPRNTVIGSWNTRNGIGTNEGSNYERASGIFIFHPGEATEQEIVIRLKGNNAPGETVEVVLSSTITGATILRKIGKVIFSDSVPVGGVKSGFTLAYETNFIDGFLATDSGLAPDGSPCWQSRPAHGRTQAGNKELGLYADPAWFPAADPFPVIDGRRVLRSEVFPDGVRDVAGNITLCPWRPIKDASGNIIGYEPFYYTASMITSRKFRTVTVGDRVEARFAMPVLGDRGAWPAWWLMPMPPFNWPPEIDGMEWPIKADHNAFTYYTTQHWSSSTGSHQQLGYPIDIRALGIVGDLTGFHTYGVEIGAQRLLFDIDGKKTVEMENRAPTASWYVLLNMAFGGTWPGDPTPATSLPCDMILDWVRFYKPAI